MPTAVMFTSDKVNLVDRLSQKLKVLIQSEFESAGLNAAINLCKDYNLSDKNVEALFGLQRGTLRNLKQTHPELDWDGLLFEII